MKFIALLFGVFCFSTLSLSNDILFRRLTKLYQSNPDKCLDASKRFIEYFPEEPSSYFFASKIYFDKSIAAKTERLEFSLLKKSIGYAVKFEKKDNVNLAEKVLWEDVKFEIKKSVFRLSEALSNSNQQSLSTNLMISFSEIQKVEFNTESKSIGATIVSDNKVTTKVELLHGMPNGDEDISSSSPEGEQKLLAMINIERKKLGLKLLIWDENLAKAARYHAFDLSSQHYFDHNTYDRVNGELLKVGGTFERINRFYNATPINSENIAAGSKLAEGTYEQWLYSKGHYENMFNSQSGKVGIGVAYNESSPFKYYWVFCTAK